MPRIMPGAAALLVGLLLLTGTAVYPAEDNFGVTRIQTKSPGHKSKAKKARVKSGTG